MHIPFCKCKYRTFFQIAVMLDGFFENKIHKSTILDPLEGLSGRRDGSEFATQGVLDPVSYFLGF